MNEFILQTYHRLIESTNLPTKRYLYPRLAEKYRMLGLVGPRGVGKTSLMLQFIKNELYHTNSAFYFSADNTYFADSTLLGFVDDLYQGMNIRHVFIDEVHKYPNWNQELKNIYDAFPDLKVVFSGSSSIDLIRGSYDLSRRATLVEMQGLSFREFLNIRNGSDYSPVSLSDLLTNHIRLSQKYAAISTLMQQYQEYLLRGYYPTAFENIDNVYSTLANIIEKTIYEDIAAFFNLKTQNLIHFKRILNYLASMPPGKVRTNNIARKLDIDNKTAAHYIEILNRSGLITLLCSESGGVQLLTKPEKVYLSNTTLLAAQNANLSRDLDIGTLREIAFIQSLKGANQNFYSSKHGDFSTGKAVFEIGGKNKTWEQLKDYNGDKYLVKDNMIMGHGAQIPLYLFGFLY